MESNNRIFLVTWCVSYNNSKFKISCLEPHEYEYYFTTFIILDTRREAGGPLCSRNSILLTSIRNK
jgi:hypothetical protein